MIQLNGRNLNNRHQELNSTVIQTVKNNVNFTDIQNKTEGSDVDRLFKIDVASQYRNIDFILETLKCGDSLYISRALHCEWIADDEYQTFISPHYLEQNILPFMSRKMKNKLLATVSFRLRNADRAEEFHHYCMQNGMLNHGMNFLLLTKESFKTEVLNLHPHVYRDFDRNPEYLERFVRNSFALAELYIKVLYDDDRPQALYKLRYLYSISPDQYLNLLEKYYFRSRSWRTYGKKFSTSIMKKNKERVLQNPNMYLNLLCRDTVVKYSKSDDAKLYAVAFLPNRENDFWQERYYDSNSYFLNLIPLEERFKFIKGIFVDKYKNPIPFENNVKFYEQNLYNMMTEQEKEEWALKQLAAGKEIHGSGNDYIWYQFINFRKAFVELKKNILITPDNYKRSKIVETLVESAKTPDDLLILLNYYYDRHVNEREEDKWSFVFEIIYKHNVLKFNDDCWSSLEKIFYSLDIHHNQKFPYKINEIRSLSLKYYLIHDKPISDVYHGYIISESIKMNKMKEGFDKINDADELDKIFLFMLSCFTKHVEGLLNTSDEKNRKLLTKFVYDMLDLVVQFEKTFEDISLVIKEYVMSNFSDYRDHRIFSHLLEPPKPEFRMSDIMHYLKNDASLVVEDFSKIRDYFQVSGRRKRNINWLIRKLKIYFNHDIAPKYINLLNECLSTEELVLQTARVAVFGIFNMCDEEYKNNFLSKYVPTDVKIDHANISRNLLTIQMAICSMACQSRPPLPLSSFRDYIRGDYLHYCLSIFDSYLATLTPNQCMHFVESILNSPLSVQKHALRLAFHCFSTEKLKQIILNVWNKMKNVSLRKVLYKSLFDKVNYYHDKLPQQLELFEVLTVMTNTLNQDDDDEVFDLLTSLLPKSVFAKHFENGYNIVATFPPRAINFQRTKRILQTLMTYCEDVSLDFLRGIMEDHVKILDETLMLDEELIESQEEMIETKWKLVRTVIVKRNDVNILEIILNKCLSNWDKTHNDTYVYRKFLMEFVSELEDLSFYGCGNDNLIMNNVFLLIVHRLEKAVPAIDIYLAIWQLRSNIIVRQVLGELKHRPHDDNSLPTLKLFSSRLRDMVKEYIGKGQFFRSFLGELKGIFNDAIRRIVGFFICLKSMDAQVILCLALSEINNRDIDIFIIDYIPSSYPNDGAYLREYLNVIEKLKDLEDEECKYFMRHKFCTSDHKVRDFMIN